MRSLLLCLAVAGAVGSYASAPTDQLGALAKDTRILVTNDGGGHQPRLTPASPAGMHTRILVTDDGGGWPPKPPTPPARW